ncbi:MAG TPA: VWA domain-containing protein, partial [Caulobacteraceae bacterium]
MRALILAGLAGAALMAAVLVAVPSVSLKLVVFDTSVVDLSSKAADPVDVLMSVQLGGGTDIGQALEYCESLITQPTRTVVVLV